MDLRTERTKKNIVNAFIELRQHKPLEKITVTELAELACINKATFYSHYHDIYDLTEQLEDEYICAFLDDIKHPDYLLSNPKQAIKELILSISSHKELLNTLFSGSRFAIFANKFERNMKELVYTQYPEYRGSLECDVVLSVLTQGCFHACFSHSEADFDEVIEIIGNIHECIKKNFFEI